MDAPRIRLFVAVSIPRGHLEAIDEQISWFKNKVVKARWTTLDNQHVTLKFLGSTPEDRLPAVEEACRVVATSHAPASVSLTEVGAFPSRNRVRVLFVGLADEASLLTRIAANLDRAFEPLGYPTESRAWKSVV